MTRTSLEEEEGEASEFPVRSELGDSTTSSWTAPSAGGDDRPLEREMVVELKEEFAWRSRGGGTEKRGIL